MSETEMLTSAVARAYAKGWNEAIEAAAQRCEVSASISSFSQSTEMALKCARNIRSLKREE